MSIHRASANSWGDQACARVCQVILEANDGAAQQVIENRTDLLDLLSVEELQRSDDLGLTLPYLAVFYDRPEILEYLHKRGLDLSIPCDPCDYGTCMYYAITLQKQSCIVMLDLLDNVNMRDTFDYLKEKEFRAVTLFLKHYWRRQLRRNFLETKKSALLAQRIIRGFLARRKLLKLRNKRLKQEREDKVLKKQPSSMAPVSKKQSMVGRK